MVTLSFEHRPGTLDDLAYREVMMENEYRLPKRFDRRDVLIDVGAHIGCFTVAASVRGAGQVWAYECDKENFEILKRNTATLLGVKAFRKAVWRSDEDDGPLFFSGYPGGFTACGTVLDGALVDGENARIPVEKIALDLVIEEASKRSGRIRMLKVDCEGAEFPILYTAKKLGLVDEIVGEVHEFPNLKRSMARWSMADMAEYLNKQGFVVHFERQERPDTEINFYLFWARR